MKLNLSDTYFSGTDIIKILSPIGFMGMMWHDLKTDQERIHSKIEQNVYRIEQLEKHFPVKEYSYLAILPNEIKLETERRN